MMKRFLWLAIFAGSLLCAHAQERKERTIDLWGHVKSAYIKQGILGAKVTLMRAADSTVVDSMRVFQEWHGDNKIDVAYKFVVPARRGDKYIIRAEHPDYETLDVNFTMPAIGRNTVFEADYHFMKPVRRSYDKDGGQLGEVVVAKTRIKMFTKGDTLIYNADAFKLPEGSMLDDLVRQLPGAELKGDQIYINGELVRELTLNGRDFFGNNRRVMLENLPYYTVNQLKVFRKDTERNEWLGREVEEKRLTMDVVLKRQYNTGTLANIQAGAAPLVSAGSGSLSGDDEEALWLARLFALRYTDNSRLTLFGLANNVNEEEKPQYNGDFWGQRGAGHQRTHRAGLDLLVDQADKKWQESLSTEVKWTRNLSERQTSTENFMANGSSTFSRIWQQTLDRNFSFSAQNAFKSTDSRNPWHYNVQLGASVANGSSEGLAMQAQTDADPDRWGNARQMLDSAFAATLSPDMQRMLVNRSSTQSQGHNHFVSGWTSAGLWHRFPWGDDGGVNLRASATRDHGRSFSRQFIDYPQLRAVPVGGNAPAQDSAIFQNRYNQTFPNRTYDYSVAPYMQFSLTHGFSLYTDYTYNQHYYEQDNQAYLLNRLEGFDAAGNALGTLPSTREALQLGLDANNSNRQSGLKRTHAMAAALSYSAGSRKPGAYSVRGRLYFTARHYSDRIDYHSQPMDTALSQHAWKLNPALEVRVERRERNDSSFSHRWTLECETRPNLPSLLSQVAVRNDQDPLHIRLGNPNLRGTTDHKVALAWHRERMKPTLCFQTLSWRWAMQEHSLSQGYTYDPATGIYTYRPMNVNGNWNTSLSHSFTYYFDRDQNLSMSLGTSGDYSRNVDYAALSGMQSAGLSHVDNWYADQSVAFSCNTYSPFFLRLELKGNVGYRHAHQRERTIDDVNAVNFNYGMSAHTRLPWEIALRTSLTMYSRRGYADHSMNTDNLIWNMQLARSFMKRRLSVQLEAYDLLRRQKNTNIVVNGQGRTENTWNSLPRFVMLSAAYKFQKFPKNKQGRQGF